MQADYFVKLLLLGDTGVGKSSLLQAFMWGDEGKNMIGTAGVDHKIKNITLKGGKTAKVDIWDTAG